MQQKSQFVNSNGSHLAAVPVHLHPQQNVGSRAHRYPLWKEPISEASKQGNSFKGQQRRVDLPCYYWVLIWCLFYLLTTGLPVHYSQAWGQHHWEECFNLSPSPPCGRCASFLQLPVGTACTPLAKVSILVGYRHWKSSILWLSKSWLLEIFATKPINSMKAATEKGPCWGWCAGGFVRTRRV